MSSSSSSSQIAGSDSESAFIANATANYTSADRPALKVIDEQKMCACKQGGENAQKHSASTSRSLSEVIRDHEQKSCGRHCRH